MLPDPKKVSELLNKLLKSPEERRQEKEMDRDVQVRMTKANLRRHIQHQKEMSRRLRDLAKRALALNDQPRFKQTGKQLLWTRTDIQRWEQYLLSLEILEARRDQMRASVDLLGSIKSMTESLAEAAGPKQVVELQRELEQGLARAASLEERMDVMMELLDSTLASDMPADDGMLRDLEEQLTTEVAAEETADFDREIEDGLAKIRSELNRTE
jgi:hypothetical protein